MRREFKCISGSNKLNETNSKIQLYFDGKTIYLEKWQEKIWQIQQNIMAIGTKRNNCKSKYCNGWKNMTGRIKVLFEQNEMSVQTKRNGNLKKILECANQTM